jgi:hypothetical protein
LSSCAEEKAHSVPLGDESEKFPYIWDDNPDVKAGVKAKERQLLKTPNRLHEFYTRPWTEAKHQGKGNRGVEKRIIY